MQRVPCRSCGVLILPSTADKNGGLCIPCKGGYRASIEAGKRRREDERKYEQSAERIYWRSLVSRVHETPQGFSALSRAEKSYFAVSCLIGEVYNGGFDQFFFNSSGELYEHAIDGLLDLESTATADLLVNAKDAVFGDRAVPSDIGQRRAWLRDTGSPTILEQLDQEFWKDRENLGERLRQFALTHGLYKDG